MKSEKKGGIISRPNCLCATEKAGRYRGRLVKLRIRAYFGIVVALGMILCRPGPLQAKQWLIEPEGQREIKAVKISPDRQELDEVRRLLVRGKAGKANKMLGKWFKKFPDSALRAEAMYYTGQSLEGLGKLYKAFEKYEKLVEEFGDTKYFHKALEAQFGIAGQYLNGRKRRVLGIFKISADDVGLKILERIPERWPSSLLAERSLMRLGDYYLQKKQYDDAVYAYDQLIVSYSSSVFVREARLQVAKAYLSKFNGSAFDAAPLIEAKERLLEYQGLYGRSKQSSEVQLMLAKIEELQAQREYDIGRFYQRTGKKASARMSFERVVRRWPNSTWAARARGKLRLPAKKKAGRSKELTAVTKAVKED